MSKDPYESYRSLLKHWEGRCILCGEPFANMESITKEHLVPRSKGGRGYGNLAPSHFSCNQVRENLPLIAAIRKIEQRRKMMGEEQFRRWINKSVPNRRPTRGESQVCW